MAAKKNGKAARRAPKAKATESSRAPSHSTWSPGDRVRVLSGDYGNARGEVASVAGDQVSVNLDAEAHTADPRVFDADNLAAALGRFDR